MFNSINFGEIIYWCSNITPLLFPSAPMLLSCRHHFIMNILCNTKYPYYIYVISMLYLMYIVGVYTMYRHGTPICLLIRNRNAYCIEYNTYLIKCFSLGANKRRHTQTWTEHVRECHRRHRRCWRFVLLLFLFFFFDSGDQPIQHYFIFLLASFWWWLMNVFIALDMENSMGKIEIVLVGRW